MAKSSVGIRANHRLSSAVGFNFMLARFRATYPRVGPNSLAIPQDDVAGG